ncbi:hypothetical protein EVAR_19429_1 [Eumeta japonica]|uniref:Uncharacterized protein n=1 Tax=Eumeta variegata TaxID=151549 RepID=A0A4C1TRL7_EUMVA|nr:hypothetical protein EVAR_19429_1 [Eumeta japonica]
MGGYAKPVISANRLAGVKPQVRNSRPTTPAIVHFLACRSRPFAGWWSMRKKSTYYVERWEYKYVMTKAEKGMLWCFGHLEQINESKMIKQIYRANVSDGRVGKGQFKNAAGRSWRRWEVLIQTKAKLRSIVYYRTLGGVGGEQLLFSPTDADQAHRADQSRGFKRAKPAHAPEEVASRVQHKARVERPPAGGVAPAASLSVCRTDKKLNMHSCGCARSIFSDGRTLKLNADETSCALALACRSITNVLDS